MEISETNINLPIIDGYETLLEKIKPGLRLETSDLVKLETVLKVFKYAKVNGIDNKITKINIANKNDYIVRFEEDKKTVYLGDASALDKKMQYLVLILQDETGIEAEVFMNVDINKENFYIREQV